MKAGYKHTGAGVIPSDWDVKYLGDLFVFRNGVNADKSSYGHGTPFVNVLEPITYSHLRGSEIPGRVSLPHSVEAAFALQHGDILFNRTSETQEEVGLAAAYVGNERVVYGGFVIRGRPAPETFDATYSGYALRASSVRAQLISMGQGAIRANIGQKDLSKVLAVLPPLREQRAIGATLAHSDALLAALDALIAKKRDLKRGAIQQLLSGRRRLPGFEAPWEKRSLGQCLLSPPDYGINAPAVRYSDRLPTYLRITDISEEGNFEPAPRVSVDSTEAGKYVLSAGDVVFARTGASVGKSYRYRPEDGPLVFAGFLIRVRPNPDLLLPSFLAAQASSERYWNWVRTESARSGQPGINGREYSHLPILVPPVEEQAAIAAIFSDMDGEIAYLAALRTKTLALKQAMMQQLLTGRIRLT